MAKVSVYSCYTCIYVIQVVLRSILALSPVLPSNCPSHLTDNINDSKSLCVLSEVKCIGVLVHPFMLTLLPQKTSLKDLDIDGYS